MAILKFIYGTMSSMKTANLIVLSHNLSKSDISNLVLKPCTDTRNGFNTIKSRIEGLEIDCVTIDNSVYLYDTVKEISDKIVLDYVLIDESQFLTSEQIDEIQLIVDNLGINVFCYGLKSDFRSYMFPSSQRLFEMADEIEELSTLCRCGAKAILNARIDDMGNIIRDGVQIEVGFNYVPLCRKCYKKNSVNINNF